jgi:hypothetical protein
MDAAELDQILADGRQMAVATLETYVAEARGKPALMPAYFDAVLNSVVVSTLLKHHESLWPFSNRVGNRLMFGGVTFSVAVGRRVWEPSVLEVAYVPEQAAERIESQFGIDFAVAATDGLQTVRLYPPRAEVMFEFQQDAVVEVVRSVVTTGEAWFAGRSSLDLDFPAAGLTHEPDAGVTDRAEPNPDAHAETVDPTELADLVREILGGDLSEAEHMCQSCGAIHKVGAHHLYRSCGLVARCPTCDAVAAVISFQPERYVVRLDGSWTVPT